MRLNSGGMRPVSRGMWTEAADLQAAGGRGALATLIWAQGSAPASRWAKLLVRGDGSRCGTVGGGALEAAVVEAAPEVAATGRARVLEFDLSPGEAAASGMICGGRCAVLVEPVAPERNGEEAVLQVFAAAARAEAGGEPVVVVTVMAAEGEARKLGFTQSGRAIGSSGDAEMDRALAEEARAALEARAPRYAEEPVAAHFEPVLPYPTLLIFGAGHVAQPLAQMAALAGFRVIVVDDREEFANRERFPTADEVVVAEVAEAFARAQEAVLQEAVLQVEEESYVVAVTRGHLMDEEVVAQALGTPARYIGMIGSRRKVTAVRERLRGRGFGEADLDRIHAPIGLDIGADTVEEIAVSIVAELIQERRRGA